MKLETFKIGGVHPSGSKLSADQPIKVMPIPDTVYIPAAQHIGKPADIIVQKGDKVKVGQLIAKQSGFVSANIHSSVSGTVTAIGPVPDPSGIAKNGVTIKVEGDEWMEDIDRTDTLITDVEKFSPKEIIERVTAAGIVGMGGATFPAHVKFTVPIEKKAEALLINGVECEPYLTADHRVMLEKSEQLMVGVKLIMRAVGTEKAFIGIEANKPDAIEKLTELTRKYAGIKVVPLALKYPQGSEKHLIKAIMKREVPSTKLPIDVGAVVSNAGTAVAVYEAVMKNKPLIERVVTVTGNSVKQPSNFLARIGTPVKMLIEAAGGIPEDTGKIISGGPMMGKAATNTDFPVAKGTSGVLLMPESLAHRGEPGPCIRCGKCVDACPMGLEPYLLSVYSRKKMWDEAEQHYIYDCIECGCCVFSCPANRPLLDYMRLGKSTVMGIIRSRKK
ncbi:MAG: electron transport complex subunit RsxC [Bacteroidales bacterium]|nr:electron transport complex subunit RsxC [Bacteroidales bacterium]